MEGFDLSDHAVTVLITRNVKSGCEAEFERVSAAVIHVATGFEGFLGSQLVHPGDGPEVHDSMYHVVMAFDTQEHLDAWYESPERELALAATIPLIHGGVRLKPVSGLGLWFRTAQQAAALEGGGGVLAGDLPTVYLLFWLTGGVLEAWPLLARTAVLTIAVVLLMTWVVAPRLTTLFRSWLVVRR